MRVVLGPSSTRTRPRIGHVWNTPRSNAGRRRDAGGTRAEHPFQVCSPAALCCTGFAVLRRLRHGFERQGCGVSLSSGSAEANQLRWLLRTTGEQEDVNQGLLRGAAVPGDAVDAAATSRLGPLPDAPPRLPAAPRRTDTPGYLERPPQIGWSLFLCAPTKLLFQQLEHNAVAPASPITGESAPGLGPLRRAVASATATDQ